MCDSWYVFVEFSTEEGIVNMTDVYKLSAKKRKVVADESEILGHLPSSSVKSKGILSPGKQRLKDLKNGSKHYRTKKLPFENAKDCLLSLKKSLQSLHKKHMFPYNPKVLSFFYVSYYIPIYNLGSVCLDCPYYHLNGNVIAICHLACETTSR